MKHEDDLIPWQQSQRTCEAPKEKGVEAEIRIVEGVVHLFDLYYAKGLKRFEKRDQGAWRAVEEGYEFLRKVVGTVDSID